MCGVVTLFTAGVLHYYGYFNLASIGDNMGPLTTGKCFPACTESHYQLRLLQPR